MSLAEATRRRRQQVAECNTAMEHPVTTTKNCVRTRVCVCARSHVRPSVCMCAPSHECQPKPGSNHQDCGTCVCRDSDRNCSSIFCPGANRSLMSSRAAAETTCLFRNGHQKVFNATRPWVLQAERVIVMAISVFYFNHLALDAARSVRGRK